MRQIIQINDHVTQLEAAIDHEKITSQKDRTALDKSYEHLYEFRNSYNDSELLRAKFENDLNEERQEHRMCQEALSHERISHQETERNLSCVWNANSRLQELLSEVQPKDEAEVEACPSIDISELVMELEAKNFNIEDLESALEEQRRESESSISLLEEKLCNLGLQRAGEIASKDRIIDELEDWLHRKSEPLPIIGNSRRKRGGRRRRRNGTRGRSEARRMRELSGGEKSRVEKAQNDNQVFVDPIKMEEE